jgi:hypothetical protein
MAWQLVSAPSGTMMSGSGSMQAGQPVLAIAWDDENDQTKYLVAGGDGPPQWFDQDTARSIWMFESPR